MQCKLFGVFHVYTIRESQPSEVCGAYSPSRRRAAYTLQISDGWGSRVVYTWNPLRKYDLYITYIGSVKSGKDISTSPYSALLSFPEKMYIILMLRDTLTARPCTSACMPAKFVLIIPQNLHVMTLPNFTFHKLCIVTVFSCKLDVTPVMVVALEGHLPELKILLEQGADMFKKTPVSHTRQWYSQPNTTFHSWH